MHTKETGNRNATGTSKKFSKSKLNMRNYCRLLSRMHVTFTTWVHPLNTPVDGPRKTNTVKNVSLYHCMALPWSPFVRRSFITSLKSNLGTTLTTQNTTQQPVHRRNALFTLLASCPENAEISRREVIAHQYQLFRHEEGVREQVVVLPHSGTGCSEN
jgi:hypothetical protein